MPVYSESALWTVAKPLLQSIVKKDFILHTKTVVEDMKRLIRYEGGDEEILIPAAMLHDVGWVKVALELQLATEGEKSLEALKQHIAHAPEMVELVLKDFDFGDAKVQKIIEVIVSHKFCEPKEKDKQLLIDADTLSDTHHDVFWSDVSSYKKTPRELWNFRSKNTFFTKTAANVFKDELQSRLEEVETFEKIT